MVHFTWLQIGGFILVSLAVIWAIVWAIGRIAKAVPPSAHQAWLQERDRRASPLGRGLFLDSRRHTAFPSRAR